MKGCEIVTDVIEPMDLIDDGVGRTSVDKAIAVLKAFHEDAYTGVGVSELSRRSGLSKSTSFRLLRVLEDNDLLERAGTDYRFSDTFRTLVDPNPSQNRRQAHDNIRDVLMPFASELFLATQSTVYLVVLDNAQAVCLNVLMGREGIDLPFRIGQRIPAYCTGAGKVLLAHDPNAAAQMLREPRRMWTPNTIIDEEALRVELAGARRDGIGMVRGELTTSMFGLAAPVLVGERAVASIAVACPPERFHQFGTVLRRATLEAMRALAPRPIQP